MDSARADQAAEQTLIYFSAAYAFTQWWGCDVCAVMIDNTTIFVIYSK